MNKEPTKLSYFIIRMCIFLGVQALMLKVIYGFLVGDKFSTFTEKGKVGVIMIFLFAFFFMCREIKEFVKAKRNGKVKKDDYLVSFQGANVKKREANKIGLSIIFGLLGIPISVFFFGAGNSTASYITITICAAVGYFIVGNKVFKE